MIFEIVRNVNDFFRKRFHVGVMRNFPYRTSTLFAKDLFKNRKDLICAEIGSWKGENALDILRNLPNIKTLYLIDPWEKYDKYNKKEVNELNDCFKGTLKRLKKYKHKIKIIKKYSSEAVDDLPDNLDFIYIDANHKYEYAKQDMELYYEKVRNGGVLAGHDISWWPGVSKAFCEFSTKRGLDPLIRGMDWMVVKK